jgi:hypothetical protein
LSKIVLAQPNREMSDYYEFMLNGEYNFEIIHCNNLDQVKEKINADSEIAVLILSNAMTDYSTFVTSLHANESARLPVVVTGNKGDSKQLNRIFKGNLMVSVYEACDDPSPLYKSINKFLELQSRVNERNADYCKVKAQHFYGTEKVTCDVYLKLSEEKFVKIFHRFQVVTPEDFKKYEEKKCHFFFVKQKDYKQLMKGLTAQLEAYFHSQTKPSGSKELIASSPEVNALFPQQLQDMVRETIDKIGLDENVLKMTSMAITSTLSIIKKNDRFFETLKGSLQNKNYISEHSFLLAYISCAVCAQTPWRGASNNMKLTLAAFFHDIALTEDSHAMIMKLNDPEMEEFSPTEKKIVKEHMFEAKKVIDQIAGIPEDVEKIIVQHHECFDGSGFPRGVDYKQIAPLSAVFTVCLELVHYLYQGGLEPELIGDIVSEFREKYNKGNFKHVVEALGKVFKQGLIEQDKTG